MAHLESPDGAFPEGHGLDHTRSAKLFTEALNLMPGGVSSPVRAFGAVGSEPFFVQSASGATITDVDGNQYIDLVQSWGALLFGHAHPEIVRAIADAAARGTSFGTPSELEVEMARTVVEMVPGVERVRFVSSGTEAGMSAARLARAVTGRDKLLKFSGCYHGHVDALLVQAGSGVATLGILGTPGVTEGTASDTVTCEYNDLDAVREAVEPFADQVAAILVEPVAANMGLVVPHDGFLEGLRSIADDIGALLVFDEVITGFRLGAGGAQQRFDVRADLVLLGKIIGGGLPVGAVAGPAELLDQFAPAGPVYQAGTLSGNPVALAAGLSNLQMIQADPGIYGRLQERARSLVRGLIDAADHAATVPLYAAAIGGLAGFFFSQDEVTNYSQAVATSEETYGRFFRSMLERGVFLPPSRFEALFLGEAHTEDHIDHIVHSAADVLATIR
ncbi:MAG: glutamate-1-semialdehyde 2,1-aminomutase [Actinomycetota bacterium]